MLDLTGSPRVVGAAIGHTTLTGACRMNATAGVPPLANDPSVPRSPGLPWSP